MLSTKVTLIGAIKRTALSSIVSRDIFGNPRKESRFLGEKKSENGVTVANKTKNAIRNRK
jgi:hypothetical protein